ncbi:transcriptional regulator, AraC family [Chitinophaga sp. CF118]|uniref:AraC family transcriptional regulator n=1 Tax=Chitinophaga sp. CF118 TaxID=1884367 RepID=UPI0008E4C64B|nr:AraC family transcriptional regulator [Chitinophaga sp. CF118]SFE09057.1 transcriptional regulator, AraC family [Chitinophaga sp. CF118]
MFKEIVWEISPLAQNDCFTLFSRQKEVSPAGIHSHEELELNLILNAAGAKRIIGDHMDKTGNIELVLLGPGLPHGWSTDNCKTNDIHAITLQFSKELFPSALLQKNQMVHIRMLFEDAKRGVLFSAETAEKMVPRMLRLNRRSGFDAVIEFLSILHDLSISRRRRKLSDITFTRDNYSFGSRRIERVLEFLHRDFGRKIKLSDASRIANMSEGAFSRFIKKHTGYSFTENLMEIRLGHVSRMLIDTTLSVSEIADRCGFNNMPNFNRIFRERKGSTPKAFRQNYLRHCMLTTEQ